MARREYNKPKDNKVVVEIPFSTNMVASNGVGPTSYAGVSIQNGALYFPSSGSRYVAYNMDAFCNDYNRLTCEFDAMYTRSNSGHGALNLLGWIDYNTWPREHFSIVDKRAKGAFPKNVWVHIKWSLDFSGGNGVCDLLEVLDFPVVAAHELYTQPKPTGVQKIGNNTNTDNLWIGYIKNLKFTFEK